MTKRKRKRWISGLLCVLIVCAYLISLPFAQSVRHRAVITLNKQGYNVLWSPGLKRITRNEKGWPHRWVRKTHYFLTSNLESLGDLESIRVPISKLQFEQFPNWSFPGSWENVPGCYTDVFVYSHPDGTCSFEAQFSKHESGAWAAFSEQLKETKPSSGD